jgi:hypothetical protein
MDLERNRLIQIRKLRASAANLNSFGRRAQPSDYLSASHVSAVETEIVDLFSVYYDSSDAL